MPNNRLFIAFTSVLFILLISCETAPGTSPAPSPASSVSPSASPDPAPAPASPASEARRFSEPSEPENTPSAAPKNTKPEKSAAPEKSASPSPAKTPEPTKKPAPKYAPGKTLSTFQTSIRDKRAARINNIVVCAKAINGTVVGSGEVFSFNGTVGRRTAARGYKKAPVYYSDGKEDALGGGICQNSTTLYMAAKKAGLKIVERHEHMYELDYIDLGNDATVFYGKLDFRFKNTKDFPVFISMSVKGGTVTASISRANEA